MRFHRLTIQVDIGSKQKLCVAPFLTSRSEPTSAPYTGSIGLQSPTFSFARRPPTTDPQDNSKFQFPGQLIRVGLLRDVRWLRIDARGLKPLHIGDLSPSASSIRISFGIGTDVRRSQELRLESHPGQNHARPDLPC